jgi:Arc/MetJ-type ribon-helix-helix transcriptional regulator
MSKPKTKKTKKPSRTAWINTRIEKKKRDAVDKLVKAGNYASRSEFFRKAVDTQLAEDLKLIEAVADAVRK